MAIGGKLSIQDGSGLHTVSIKANDTAIPANVTWTLPTADGSAGQVLSTDGTGILNWTTGGAGPQGPQGPQGVGTEGPQGPQGASGGGASFYDAGDSGSSITIDWSNGSVQSVNISASTIISFSNASSGGTYVLIMNQNSNYARSWGSSIKWSDGLEPTWSASAGNIDIATFLYANGVWYGGGNKAFG